MLSVIICTWNRCESLRETFRSLESMCVPSGIDWELIVVDNNSSDATAQTIEEFRGRLPIRPVFEPTAGKSYALNTAAKAALGEYFIFTDDDVLVDTNWLTAYRDAFRLHPDASLFGGPVEPLFEGTGTPAWLKDGFHVVANAFAVIDSSAAIGSITSDVYPYGANMALHRRVFDTHQYRVEVGRSPGSKVGGEEMILIWELLAAGGKGFWIPEARVKHSIPSTRQKLSYLRDYYLGSGGLMDFLEDKDIPLLLGGISHRSDHVRG